MDGDLSGGGHTLAVRTAELVPARRGLRLDGGRAFQAEVQILSADGLTAVRREHIRARAQGGGSFRRQVKLLIGGVVTGGFDGQNAVDVDLGVFVVVHDQGQVGERAGGHLELAPQPQLAVGPDGGRLVEGIAPGDGGGDRGRGQDDPAWRVAGGEPAGEGFDELNLAGFERRAVGAEDVVKPQRRLGSAPGGAPWESPWPAENRCRRAPLRGGSAWIVRAP